jgi:hypothetical protein
MNAKLPSIFVSLEQFENITVIENCENPIENNLINTFKSIDIIDTSGEEIKKIFTVYTPARHYLKSWKIQVFNRLINKTFYFTQDIDAFLYLNDEIQKTFVPLFQDVIQQDTMSINQYKFNALQIQKNQSTLENLKNLNNIEKN